MVTVVQTPIGIKVIDQSVSATITTDGDPGALVTKDGHSLVTGDYVYIESDIDEYNGMWYVVQGDYNHFRFSANAESDLIPYYQDADITYYQTQTHEWSSVFLPIIYKATNDLWPINTVDPVRTVTSQSDDNGYTMLHLSGGGTGANALEYVKLNDGSVHQVVEVGFLTTTINLAYDATNVITTAQKSYNNYQILVNIYAGLPGGQPWEYKKPFRNVATLSLTPDADNNIMFSVADYVKGLITIRNNPLLYSMPLNLDAFTGFYITTAEAYDTSDGYSIAREQSDFATDPFIGYAVGGVLPFKNLYSGHYSEYIYTTGTPAKWLNTLTTVIGVVGKYFDISFIKNIAGAFILLIDKYANDYRYETLEVAYEDQGVGVYRLPLDFTSEYDQYCIRAQIPATAGSPASTEDLSAAITAAPTGFSNTGTGLVSWVLDTQPDAHFDTLGSPGTPAESTYLTFNYPFIAGNNYTLTVNMFYQVTGTVSNPRSARLRIMDGSNNVQFSASTTPPAGGGDFTITITFTANSSCTRFGIMGIMGGGSFGATRALFYNDAELLLNVPAVPASAAIDITEELCIDVYEVCSLDDGATTNPEHGARRLLEDGEGFRLLED